MGYSTLGHERLYIYCSSSVYNFKEKLDKKFNLPDWNYSKIFKPTFFFGLYRWRDYLRFILHRGKRYVFWCGSDILNLNWIKRRILWFLQPKHYCENEVEYKKLLQNGIVAKVQPLFLGNVDDFPVSYKYSKIQHVWLCVHPGREKEYGLDIIAKVAKYVPEINFHIYGNSYKDYTPYSKGHLIYHGIIPEKQFNEEIKNYQSSLRCNSFDGASEVMIKALLLGQYPITNIEFPYVSYYNNDINKLIELLKDLKNKKQPNFQVSNYWRNQLKNFTL